MVEVTIRNYLAGALDGVPVFLEMPEVPSRTYPHFPQEFVLVQRLGGGQVNKIDSASFAFQSYSLKSLRNAAALDKRVREAMHNIITLPSISASKLASNYNFTDTTTKRYRYQAVFDLTYYED